VLLNTPASRRPASDTAAAVSADDDFRFTIRQYVSLRPSRKLVGTLGRTET